MEELLLDWVRGLYDAISWPGVVFLMAIESAGIPFPSEIIMPVSGWILIKERGHGVSLVFLAAFFGALGNLLGSLVAYWIGAKGGLPLLYRYGRYVLITRHDVERARNWFIKYGDWAVFFSRLLPVVRTFISFPAGVAKMSILKFSFYTFVGSYIWSLGLAYAGFQLGSNWDKLRSVMRPFDIPILIAIVLLIGFYIYKKRKQLAAEGKKEVSTPSPERD